MLEWFIDLAYFFEDVPEILYMFLMFAISFFLVIISYEHDIKEELEEKAENYEKVQDFIEYLFRNKQDLRKEVADYLRRKKMIENREERQKDIDDFMNIL